MTLEDIKDKLGMISQMARADDDEAASGEERKLLMEAVEAAVRGELTPKLAKEVLKVRSIPFRRW